MMLAWLSSSERMKSSLPRMEETVPALAVKPDWKTTQASTCLKAAMRSFELHMDAHGAGDGADGAGADAVAGDGAGGGLGEAWVVAEAEVVIRGEVDDLAAVVVADGALLVVEDTESEVGAAGAEVVEDGGQVGELRARCGVRGSGGGGLGAGVGDFGGHKGMVRPGGGERATPFG